jgi:hypothetical protein
MEANSEWFTDESLRPLEHYFRFNEWKEHMLESVSRSESLDAIRVNYTSKAIQKTMIGECNSEKDV